MPLESGIELVNWMAFTQNGTNKAVGRDSLLPAPVELPSGDTLTLHLLWRSPEEQEQADALTASVQLFAPTGERLAQDDTPLRGNLGGRWYDPLTFERVPAGAEEAIDGALRLGEVSVE